MWECQVALTPDRMGCGNVGGGTTSNIPTMLEVAPPDRMGCGNVGGGTPHPVRMGCGNVATSNIPTPHPVRWGVGMWRWHLTGWGVGMLEVA